jgi:hypothetical protein
MCVPYVQVELLEMRVETALTQQTIGIDKHNLRSEAIAWARLFDRKYIDRTLIGILMMFFQRKLLMLFLYIALDLSLLSEWSGINALLYYGPTLVKSIGLRGDTVTLIVSGGIGIIQFLAVLPAIIYIDRWGTFKYILWFWLFTNFVPDRTKTIVTG